MSMDVSRLQVSLEEGERWRRTLSITIPSEIVQAERRSAIRKLSGQVQLPGFRAGKVPASVIEKRFGAAINQELLDRVIGDAYRGVLDERELRPISEGQVSDVDYKADEDLTFQVSFDVSPDLELSRTGGFEVTRPSAKVGDEEVARVLEQLREEKGTWVPVEGGNPQEGDKVSVRIQRLQEEGDEPRPYEFTLGRDEAIPDVEEAIRSLEAGGEGDFTVVFPDDFPNEDRRGESDELRIFLDTRKELEKPELDDAFASDVGDFESLDELRERIREDLAKEAEQEAERAVRGQLLDQLLAANPFQVPVSMIDQYIRNMAGEETELSPEQLEQAREQVGPRAEAQVKRFLVIEELARTRDLQATPDDLDDRIEEMAERAGTEPGDLYARLQKAGRLEQLEREITERKVFDFLKSESTINEAD
ncbi:MAG: trigger factor [Gemmatimonadales bacterium]|nr:MAG: trigger factor [Gemmatimonadales bacterium]